MADYGTQESAKSGIDCVSGGAAAPSVGVVTVAVSARVGSNCNGLSGLLGVAVEVVQVPGNVNSMECRATQRSPFGAFPATSKSVPVPIA